MRKTVAIILGALLIAGPAVQTASAATEHHARKAHRMPAAASEQFLNANNSASGTSASCQNREPGNPYNPQTDYMGWSAWRENGAWDSRNDCW